MPLLYADCKTNFHETIFKLIFEQFHGAYAVYLVGTDQVQSICAKDLDRYETLNGSVESIDCDSSSCICLKSVGIYLFEAFLRTFHPDVIATSTRSIRVKGLLLCKHFRLHLDHMRLFQSGISTQFSQECFQVLKSALKLRIWSKLSGQSRKYLKNLVIWLTDSTW